MAEAAKIETAAIREEMLHLLSGEGIEIGALHNPAVVPHLKVRYVDRIPREEALLHYPELRGQDLVAVDIIDDAETLASVADKSQDFVIANHVIEHMGNPIASLLNWCRVLKRGGRLFLAVPDKRFTFDCDREITALDHLLADFRERSDERDYEHFRDFALKVSCRKFKVRPESQAEEFARELWQMKYSIHYHVWDYEAFVGFLSMIQRDFPEWAMMIVDTVPTHGPEFIFVLQRMW